MSLWQIQLFFIFDKVLHNNKMIFMLQQQLRVLTYKVVLMAMWYKRWLSAVTLSCNLNSNEIAEMTKAQ